MTKKEYDILLCQEEQKLKAINEELKDVLMKFYATNFPIIVNNSYSTITIINEASASYFALNLLKSYFPKCKIILDSSLEIINSHNVQLIVLLQIDKNITEGSFSIKSGKIVNLPAICIVGGGNAGLIYAIRTLQTKMKQEYPIHIEALSLNESPSKSSRLSQ